MSKRSFSRVSTFFQKCGMSGTWNVCLLCRWPYFCQWGVPTFSWSSTLTMLAGAISAMVESVSVPSQHVHLHSSPQVDAQAVDRGT